MASTLKVTETAQPTPLAVLAEAAVTDAVASADAGPRNLPHAAGDERSILLTSPESLCEWEQDWRQLGDACGGVIEQYDWVAACAEVLPRSGPLRITAHLRGGHLVAAAGLVVQRERGVPRRVQLGMAEFGEPTGLAARDAAALDALARDLARDPLPLVCGRIRLDTPDVAALQRAYAGRGLVVVRPQLPAPFITLDESWKSPESRLNSGRRSDLRRARRRAEELGRVECRLLTPSPEEVDSLLAEAMRVEQASWKGESGTALASDAVGGDFFRRLAQRASRHGTLRVALLLIGDRAVAMQIALVHGGRYWLFKIGYDPEFARCSPGMLLLRETIAAAAQEGLASYEFLGRDEPWIRAWTSERHECVCLRAYPWTPAGMAALMVDGSHHAARVLGGRVRSAGQEGRRAAGRVLRAVVRRAAGRYIAGDQLTDAQRVRETLARRGLAATIGYWDADGEHPRQVADQYLAGLDLLPGPSGEDYLSIKLPSLGEEGRLLDEVVQRAVERGGRLHFDALAPDQADRTRAVVEALQSRYPAARLSFTLPGRWRRSVADADWVVDRKLPVRVVKGQWEDPADPHRDLRQGYLEVIDRLAGRAVHVSVATHDVPLAAEALRRLREAGTPCDLELLYGLPMRASLRQARRLQVPVRVYIPYGAAYLPYAVSRLRKNPAIAMWLVKDFITGLACGT